MRGLSMSLPLRERGLKPVAALSAHNVAPPAGAWIETQNAARAGIMESLPLRERGLKHGFQ